MSIFKSVDFPAPDGPIMAVSSPDLRRPLTFLRMIFSSVIYNSNYTSHSFRSITNVSCFRKQILKNDWKLIGNYLKKKKISRYVNIKFKMENYFFFVSTFFVIIIFVCMCTNAWNKRTNKNTYFSLNCMWFIIVHLCNFV